MRYRVPGDEAALVVAVRPTIISRASDAASATLRQK